MNSSKEYDIGHGSLSCHEFDFVSKLDIFKQIDVEVSLKTLIFVDFPRNLRGSCKKT